MLLALFCVPHCLARRVGLVIIWGGASEPAGAAASVSDEVIESSVSLAPQAAASATDDKECEEFWEELANEATAQAADGSGSSSVATLAPTISAELDTSTTQAAATSGPSAVAPLASPSAELGTSTAQAAATSAPSAAALLASPSADLKTLLEQPSGTSATNTGEPSNPDIRTTFSPDMHWSDKFATAADGIKYAADKLLDVPTNHTTCVSCFRPSWMEDQAQQGRCLVWGEYVKGKAPKDCGAICLKSAVCAPCKKSQRRKGCVQDGFGQDRPEV